MADTLKFGPEWLRQLSSGGSMTSPPASPSFGGKYKLAENRYGREEMLALFHPNAKAPDDLKQFTTILVERCQDPMAMVPPTEDEQILLASNVNSNVAFRQAMGRGGSNERGPPGMRGAGRGGLSNRGRGRGRGDGPGFYQRGGFDEPVGRGGSSRGRGGREGGATKVIERDSSGFLSARSFDESTDRRSKDPFSRSTPSSGDRWSELRSVRGEPAGRGGGTTDAPLEETNTTEERDEDWRRAGKDRQPRGNWRDAKPSFDDDGGAGRYQRSYSRQMSYERSRSHHPEEDEMPEWANDEMGAGDEGGTFDSSGAFLSLKDAGKEKTRTTTPPQQNGENRRERKQEIDKAKKALPPLKIKTQTPPTTAQQSPSIVEEKTTTNSQPANSEIDKETSETKPLPSPSTTPSNRNTPRKEELSSQSESNRQSSKDSSSAKSNNSSSQAQQGDPSAQSAPEPEANFDHLTQAAEKMMESWAAEDDDHPPSDPTTAAHPNHWFYKDPQGILQGPFTAQEMAEWYGAGYFTMNLLVKKGSDREFQPLGEIIKRGGNNQPFIPVTPSTPGAGMNPLVDPAILAATQPAVQDTRSLQQQQIFLIQQQQLLLQQQQQQQLLALRHQQLQQVIQTLSTSEEYSKLNPQQIQNLALSIVAKQTNKQGVLPGQQAMIDPSRGNQQTSPPQVRGGGIAAPTTPSALDENMLWGSVWDQQMRERQAVDEIAQKEAARQQEQQRIEAEQQRLEVERQKRLEVERQQLLEMERQREQHRVELEVLRERKLAEERLLEQRRLQEEKAKEEIRLQREEMERQRKELEQRKTQEIEKQEAERKRLKEEKLALERKKEQEKQEALAMERQLEVERKMKEDMKRKAELQRIKEEEERQQREEIAEREKREEKRRQAVEKAEKELVKADRQKQLEKERLDALQLPATVQWAANADSTTGATYERQLSLQEIQRKEREQDAKNKAIKAASEKQRQQELELSNQQNQLKWAANKSSSPVTGKSLREIQEEEARRLEKEKKAQQKQKAAVAASTPVVASSSTWASKPVISGTPATPSLGWANEGAWAAKKGGWDQPNNKPVKTASSEVFPSLSAAAKPQSAPAPHPQKTKQSNSSQSSKKAAQHEKVKKLFTESSSKDKFTDWCTKSLLSLNSSIDIPTFISFLRDIDNPHEVKDYIKVYLGETAKSAQFAKDFIERRSIDKQQKQAQQRLEDEESLWGPAPAVNPSNQRAAAAEAAAALEKKKKAAKKSKTAKTDASALLGFTVGASSHRLNIGEIEKAE